MRVVCWNVGLCVVVFCRVLMCGVLCCVLLCVVMQCVVLRIVVRCGLSFAIVYCCMMLYDVT